MNRENTIKHFYNICDELETSNKGVTSLCNKNTINKDTFFRLINEDKEKYDYYVRAKERQCEYWSSLIIDKGSELVELIKRGEGGENVHALVNAVKIEIDNIKWVLSKLLPRKYGDKQTVEHEGGVGITWVENRANSKPDK